MLVSDSKLTPSDFPHRCAARQIGEGSGWERWDLANWRPASSSSASQVLAEQSESADAQESEEGLKDSAIEVRRDRVRMRVYRSLVSA